MKIYEIGTGYTSIPATISAATEIVIEQLTNEFLRMGQDVEILDVYDPNRKKTKLPIVEIKIPKKLLNADIQLGIFHKLKRVVYSIALANKINSILCKTEERIVLHFHNQYNMFFFLKLVPFKYRKKCITAYTNHSGIWRLNLNEIKGIIRKKYFQEAECMKLADYVFVLNNETIINACTYLGTSKDKYILINNGVNTDTYIPLEEKRRNEIKRSYGFEGKRIVLQVGSVYENKGQLRSIKILEPLLKQNDDLIFAYVGGLVSEAYKAEIDSYVKHHNLEKKVYYLGMVSPGTELNYLYNIADCTMLSSKYEGFSLVVVESMSSGVPVLIDASAPFSLGKGNILYTDENFQNVFEREIIDNNSLEKHRKGARENVVENYSWSKISKDYLAGWGRK